MSTFKKITVVVFALAIGLLIFQVTRFKMALATLDAADSKNTIQFFHKFTQEIFIGNMITLVLLVLSNVTAFFTKKIQWVFLPGLFFAVAHIANAYKGEAIFHFKKATGLWDGSFSLGMIGAIILIAFAALVSYINYLILKYFIRKQETNSPSAS